MPQHEASRSDPEAAPSLAVAAAATDTAARPRLAAGESGWHPQRFADEAELQAFAKLVRDSIPVPDMNYDLEWVAAAHAWPTGELLVLADWQGGKIVGIALFIVSDAPLEYGLGSRVFLRRTVRQFKLYQGIITLRPDRERAVADCFQAAARAMPKGGVVFAGAIPVESELHSQLVAPRSRLRASFFVLPWGEETQHCRIRWEGGVEPYLASIGKKSAKELQRNAKALFADPALTCEVRGFRTPDDVERFLRDGVEISDKTYQKKDLGLGIERGGAVERVIRFAAARGAFLGFILYVDGKPAAFRYGFVCARTCTMKQTGYDPVWADRQIGGVLFLETLRAFERIKLPVDWLDFMPDINLFKLRTTNDKRQIRHFYLFPRTTMGAVQFATLGATDYVSRTLGRWVKRYRRAGELEKYLERTVARSTR